MAPHQKTAGAQGTTYEARVCLFLIVRAYTLCLKSFKLQYHVGKADKFDDIVFSTGNGKYFIIQLKHKENRKTFSQLFTEKFNTDFNLIKYVQAVINANSNPQFKDKIDAAVVLTNINFNLINDDEVNLRTNQSANATMWYNGLTSIKLTPFTPDPNPIFDMSNLVPNAKYYKFTKDPNIVQILQNQAVTLVKEVGNITEDEIREALEKTIYAVNQPNVQQLEELIKHEIKSYFKLHKADAIYEKLDNLLRNWCDTQNPIERPSTSTQSNTTQQHELTYADADNIFQKHVKAVSFGVTAPTDAFIGRTEELEKIKEMLYEQSSLIVSQSVKISGLGGIGKTQLTKQFIKEFGQSEFYGRIFWIEAESDDTAKNSFEQLGQKLNIQDAHNKDAEVLIDEIFQYFDGLKVLFVFDNYDKSPANEGQLVTHCLEIASDSTKTYRPFFLFTSRNRECLPGVPLLDLNVLSPEDAAQLIINELKEVNLTKDDAEKLAEVLQYFPLALRQGIAYIKEQNKKQQVLGKRYDIQDYFKKFENETQALLDFEFPDDFDKNEKTTFITWNVTLDAINNCQNHGEKAIEVLRIFSYLYADKIDSKMFLPMFNNDEDILTGVFLLLEKYSMITKIDKETTFYQIHRLVQAVVQLKFKNKNEEKLLEKTFQLINPELYRRYINADYVNEYFGVYVTNFAIQVSMDQFIQYKTLSVHMLKSNNLNTKYKKWFDVLGDSAIFSAFRTDDVNKIKALKVTTEDLKRIIGENIKIIMYWDCNKVMKYLIENDVIGVNDQIQEKSLISWSLKKNNFELVKYLFEKDADFSGVHVNISLDLIYEIKNGQTVLLNDFISVSSEAEIIQIISDECLFFATLFNQESISRILLKNIVEVSHFKIIFVAANSGQVNLVKLMLEKCSKEVLFECLLNLSHKPFCTDKEMFKIIFNNYLEKDGDVNQQNIHGYSLLNLVTDALNFDFAKLEIIHFLLDKGADPYLLDKYGYNALHNLLYAHVNNWLTSDDKLRIDELLNQKILNNLTPENFINFAVKGLFIINNWSTDEYYRGMFDRLLREIGGINVRNENGETLLINYLQIKNPKLENVNFLVKQGIDVDARDNNGKSALHYAAKLENQEIYRYLRNKVKFVDRFCVSM